VRNLKIYADVGTYDLFFSKDWKKIKADIDGAAAIVIDKKVKKLYEEKLEISSRNIISLDVSEAIKTPETALYICEKLILWGVTRDQYVVAIGGGVIQDLVTFAASFYMRGIDWVLYPTTLLAQADSCIGGKSSINFKEWKNILGNFYNPKRIYIQSEFLKTLSIDEIRSGVGEIIKVFLLSGENAVDKLVESMARYQKEPAVLDLLIIEALDLKNKILEIDALDKGMRLKMNYGHSFGHALEAATHFSIPHGIAVTIGLDIANYFSLRKGLIDQNLFSKLHHVISLNLVPNDFVDFESCEFFDALEKDKKNKPGKYGFIIPVSKGEVELKYYEIDELTNMIIEDYFKELYGK